jgi:hypothetical protein
MFEGMTREQKKAAQKRLNDEYKQRRAALAVPCPLCVVLRPNSVRKLMPQETCEAHQYKDERPYLREDKTFLFQVRADDQSTAPS